jgi:6-phosphogluconolactonase
MKPSDLIVVPDVAAAGAELFKNTARQSVKDRGRFVVNLSGGSTPLRMYEILLRQRGIPWESTWVTWGDERFVPHDSAESNFGMAKDRLLTKVPIPANQILSWPWNPDLGAPRNAQLFEQLLKDRFGAAHIFDLTFLGLGEDAHTASLFPGTGAVHAKGLATAVRTKQKVWRLTMTVGALSASLAVAFLVSGKSKLKALRDTVYGEGDLDKFPARAITARNCQLVLTDQEL